MNNVQEIAIPISDTELGGDVVKTINARELHKFLGVGRDFSTWIRGRIKEYEFVEKVDFVVVRNLSTPKMGSTKSRQQVKYDYLCTIDMGKELAMVEKTEVGRLVRRYFIACEKTMREVNASLMMQYHRAALDFEKLSEIASNAGRTLSVVGRLHKPRARERVDSLKDQIQPHLFLTLEGDSKLCQ